MKEVIIAPTMKRTREDDNNTIATDNNPHDGMSLFGTSIGEAPKQLFKPMRYQHTGIASDIDQRDRDDPLAVAEYAQDMYAHFKEQEMSMSVRPTYLSWQPEVTNHMRSVLVDWLVSVHLQYKLQQETLYLAVNLIDRYLEKATVARSKLQLVGATCMFIAAKYEEVYNCPRARDIYLICDRLYPKQEIIQMETVILSALGYKISAPTPLTFLVRYLKAGHSDSRIALLASYLLEGTLSHYPLLQYRPSQLAAASVLIARNAHNRHPWSPTLLKYTDYLEEDVIPVANAILEARARLPSDIQAINAKYSRKCFGRVSYMELSYIPQSW